jgi:hypothetical protein
MKRSRKLSLIGIAFTVLLVTGTAVVFAHPESGRWGRGSGGYPQEDLYPTNSFTFCRVIFESARGGWGRRGGGGWQTDYYESEHHFSQRLGELTTINVNEMENGSFEHAFSRLDEPELLKYPFAYMLEVGNLRFSEAEVKGLREYLQRGGFLMVDDFWGDSAWQNFEYEIKQVFPEYPIVDIPLDHEIFHIVFEVPEYFQVPSVGNYRLWVERGISYEPRHDYSSGDTSAHYRGIFDDKGRLMVVILHNTDLGDGWEEEGRSKGYFEEFSAKQAYPMGINIITYAMTH